MILNKTRAKTLLKKLPGIRQLAELRRLRAEVSRLTADRDRFQTAFAPGHFYSPLPDLRELHSRESSLFESLPERIPGIDLNDPVQHELLRKLAGFYRELPFAREKQNLLRYYYENPSFGCADAIVLYSMIRHLRPRKIVEIGCGFSSCVILDTNERFFSNAIQCVFIDPFPQLLHALLKPGDLARIEVIQDCVQDVELRVFAQLEQNDILFVDSSHVLKTGGDLNHILFEVLPRLHAGVHVHFHDVPFPFEYPKDWVFGGRAWNESYALRAFLQYNEVFEIVYFNSYLARTQRAFIEQNMPLWLENTGGSLWLRKTKETPLLDAKAPLRHEFRPSGRLDAVYLDHPRQLGRGWYELPQDLSGRWMGVFAEVVLCGPGRPGQRLSLRGMQPNPGGVKLSLVADGITFAQISLPEGPFAVTTSLPNDLVKRDRFLLRLELDKAWRPPDEDRDLGLLFGTIEIV